jgi:hypothetical protein
MGGFTATPADVGPALRDRPSRSGGVRSRGAAQEGDQALDGLPGGVVSSGYVEGVAGVRLVHQLDVLTTTSR